MAAHTIITHTHRPIPSYACRNTSASNQQHPGAPYTRRYPFAPRCSTYQSASTVLPSPCMLLPVYPGSLCDAMCPTKAPPSQHGPAPTHTLIPKTDHLRQCPCRQLPIDARSPPALALLLPIRTSNTLLLPTRTKNTLVLRQLLIARRCCLRFQTLCLRFQSLRLRFQSLCLRFQGCAAPDPAAPLLPTL